jgi:ABC-type phosphate/phosphonate transport system permease subunit
VSRSPLDFHRLASARWPFVAGALLASVGVGAAIFGSERTDMPWLFVTLILFEGWAWIAAGLVALARRPDTPAGLWMIAAGFSWMWGALEFANPDMLETLGAAFAGTLFPLILHVLVGFPTSVRLTGRPARCSPPRGARGP